MLAFGGIGGALPTIDPALQAYLPHVRVTFVLEKVSNRAASGGGLDPEGDGFQMGLFWKTRVRWTTLSQESIADVEVAEIPLDVSTLGPDMTWTLPDPIIYDALLFGECEGFAPSALIVDQNVFLNFNNTFVDDEHVFDFFTVHSTGFYTFNYEFPAAVPDGVPNKPDGTSVFELSGKVSVTCSALDSLD